MRICEISDMFHLTQDTLRYYEKIGLLDPVSKDKKGNRDYQPKDIRRLEFISCMRDAGLSIQVLQKYIERDKLIEKQSLIHKSLEKLNYKIENYEKILNKEI